MHCSNNGRVEEIKLEITVKLPGSLNEFVDELISKTVQACGTQLRAAFYLGVTPTMISNRLNHRRKKLGRLANLASHRTGAGDAASDPLPPGGQQESKFPPGPGTERNQP